MPTPQTVDPSELLDQIQARYGTWYGGLDYTGPTAQWPGRDYDEMLAEYITRNDVPALIGVVRAVLATCESSDVSDSPYRSILHTTVIRAAITTHLGGAR